MPIKTILAPIDGADHCKPLLETAFLAAREFNAHVKGLHAKVDAREAIPLLGEGMSGGMVEEMIDMAEKEAGSKAEIAARMFSDYCQHRGIAIIDSPEKVTEVTASWAEIEGREDDVIIRAAGLSDLVVVRNPGETGDPAAQVILNTVLFETARPVLVAPPQSPATLGRNIAIAWNGSLEATRAVQAALSFLPNADKVTVLTAESQRTDRDAGDGLADYFAWHGIHADIQPLTDSDQSVGEMVLGKAIEAGADLLVMGAYTHGRMRQLILGGVTSHVISHANIPVFMSH